MIHFAYKKDVFLHLTCFLKRLVTSPTCVHDTCHSSSTKTGTIKTTTKPPIAEIYSA